MDTFCKSISLVIVIVLLLGCMTDAYGFAMTGGTSSTQGESRSAMRIVGTIVCVQCNLDTIRRAHPQKAHLYELFHKQGQIVIEVTQLNTPQMPIVLGQSPRLKVRAPDRVFAKLTAEENLSKTVEITGLLNNTRTLDIFEVAIRG